MDEETYRKVCTFAEEVNRYEEVGVHRPLAWGFRCGLLAFTATASWMLLRSGYSESALARSAVAMIVFAIAGYVLGRFVQRPPNIAFAMNPGEKGNSGSQTIPIDEAAAGMLLSQSVRKEDGEILFPIGVTLDDAMIDVLREYGIGQVVVATPNGEIGDAAQQPGVREQSLEEGQEGEREGTAGGP